MKETNVKLRKDNKMRTVQNEGHRRVRKFRLPQELVDNVTAPSRSIRQTNNFIPSFCLCTYVHVYESNIFDLPLIFITLCKCSE
jgi:hypothetical protein